MFNEHPRESYPHKYAVIPLGHPVRAFIAAKVYLVRETLAYHIDGNSKRSYLVVLPYDLGENFDELREGQNRQLPLYNDIRCTNGIEVDRIYTDFESARCRAKELNAASSIPPSIIEHYVTIEHQMLELCKDMYVYP